MFLPDSHLCTTKLVEDAHQRTLHGGVGFTMAKIRENIWVSRLRQLVKKTVKGCHGCRRFHAKPVSEPPPGNLPVDRTEGDRPASYLGAMCCSMACAAFAWAAWINLIDFVVRRLAESVSISGADIDFWSGLDQEDFWRFEIPLFIENCMTLINLSK